MTGIISIILSILFLSTSLTTPTVASANEGNYQNLISAGVNPEALRVALKGYYWAESHGEVQKHIMTLVDFTKPSIEKRLWVIDMTNGQILYNGLVAHGKGSGDLYARNFSNRPGSEESSLGAMVTGQTYQGKHGTEVKIYGLERGVNNNVANRAVIFHSATYATPSFAHANGYLGRSWGCFAIDPHAAGYVFNKIKGGSFVFAYAPAENHDHYFIQ